MSTNQSNQAIRICLRKKCKNPEQGSFITSLHTLLHALPLIMLNFSFCVYSLNFADCKIDNNKTSAIDNQASTQRTQEVFHGETFKVQKPQKH